MPEPQALYKCAEKGFRSAPRPPYRRVVEMPYLPALDLTGGARHSAGGRRRAEVERERAGRILKAALYGVTPPTCTPLRLEWWAYFTSFRAAYDADAIVGAYNVWTDALVDLGFIARDNSATVAFIGYGAIVDASRAPLTILVVEEMRQP